MLIRLYIVLAMTACFFGILFYLFSGIFRWVCGVAGLVVLYLIVKCRHSDFSERKHKQGLSFLYFFSLASMLLILTVNEYHYSLDVKRNKRISHREGSKTALALTFDDLGLRKTDPQFLGDIARYLSDRGIPATFFVAAKGLLENDWTERVKSLSDEGMEIGFHGYDHKLFEFGRIFYSFNSPSYEVQKENFIKSLNLFKKKVSIKPVGFRAPVWRENRFTLQILEEFGFKYNSGRKTLMTSQAPFYRRIYGGKYSNVVNIPSSGEFTWFYGPRLLKMYQYFINRQLVRAMLKTHKNRYAPIVLVFHVERLKDRFADRLFKEIIDWILEDDTISAMTMQSIADLTQPDKL